jgi:hypothetical protein
MIRALDLGRLREASRHQSELRRQGFDVAVRPLRDSNEEEPRHGQ